MNYGILVRGLDGTASPTIYHNSIDGGSGVGIGLEQTSGILTPVVKYNIITRCDDYGIRASGTVTCNPDYNDVWGNGVDYYNCSAGADDISQDPKNGMSGPLASDSPCINVIPTDLDPPDPVTMDYLGFSRPKGSGFDMGAYEYTLATTKSFNYVSSKF